SIRYFLMMVWSLFIISLMGLFWYSKSPIISRVELPTTEIIEPLILATFYSSRFFVAIIEIFLEAL
ncbi:hypothetical protein ACVRW4_08245, partial [Streptococcus phocae subsp. phocae]